MKDSKKDVTFFNISENYSNKKSEKFCKSHKLI